MPNRRFQSRKASESEFVTVDLLPAMRRPRQFNVNVILVVLVAIFFSWLLIYWPLSGRQNTLDEVLEQQNDLENLLVSLQDQEAEYRINADAMAFQRQIDEILELQTDYEMALDDIKAAVLSTEANARFIRYDYNVVEETFTLRVALPRSITFQNVRIALLELEYVNSVTYPAPERLEFSTQFASTIVMEVDIDALKTAE